MRKVKIIKDRDRVGQSGWFHGFFQYGNSDPSEGMSACAVIEFSDGVVDYFGTSKFIFESPPAESSNVETLAQHTTQAKAAEALPRREICPECKGTGVIKEKTSVGSWTDTCEKCNGTGKLPLA